MDSKRWQQIEDLVDAASRLDPAERVAFLDRTIRNDGTLRSEVESLLTQLDADPDYLDTPLVRLDSPDGDGQHLGSYRLIRVLGEGGMGTVHLATRDETDFRQFVALKMLRRGLDTDRLLERFARERRILAELSHPNIARLIDGGASEDGRPFLVMEFIDGVPLTTYCDTHELSIEKRLNLFVAVCEAVHHAHRHLVVHRDLKPSNILVTAEGHVKLLDFGIARVLSSDETDLTQIEDRVLTPRYAAPEQLKGLPTTIASDVYSLGVVLYELLAGQPPYRLEDLSQEEIERIVCDEIPDPPSVVAAKTGRERLHPDLDYITLAALRKEPERRYASVEQLAEDIRRHQRGMPVWAGPEKLGYLARKFVSRYRTAVTAVAVVLLLLVALAVVTTVQSVRIARHAAAVELERERAEQVVQFLTDLFRASSPGETRGELVTAQELLDRGVARIDDELSDQPDVQAEMLAVIAEVNETLGRYEEAEALIRRSLELRQSLYGPSDPRVATSLNALGWILFQRGQLDEAAAYLRQALDMRRRLLGPDHIDVSRTLNDLAVVTQQRGDLDSTEVLLTEALAIRRAHYGDEHLSVAVTLNNVATLLWQQGDYVRAEETYQETLRIFLILRDEDHPQVSITRNNLAGVQSTLGRYVEAEPLYRTILETRRRVLGNDHPDVATSANTLAGLLLDRGDFANAEPFINEALSIRRTALGEEHALVSVTLLHQARFLQETGRLDEAEQLVRDVLSRLRRSVGDHHVNTAAAHARLGQVLRRQGRLEAAVASLREAHAIYREILGDSHISTALIAAHLSHALSDVGDDDEAFRLAETAVTTLQERLPKNHPSVVAALQALDAAQSRLTR